MRFFAPYSILLSLGFEQDESRRQTDSFIVRTTDGDLRDCDVVGKILILKIFCFLSILFFVAVVPCMDVRSSKSDSDYANGCKNYFRS